MKSKAPLTQTNQEKFQGRNKSKLWREQQQEEGQKSTLLRLLETKSRDQRQNKTDAASRSNFGGEKLLLNSEDKSAKLEQVEVQTYIPMQMKMPIIGTGAADGDAFNVFWML